MKIGSKFVRHIALLAVSIAISACVPPPNKTALQGKALSVPGQEIDSGKQERIAKFQEVYRTASYYSSIGQFGEAEKLYEEALALQKDMVGTDNLALAETTMNLALEKSNQGNFGAAVQYLDRAEKIILGQGSSDTLLVAKLKTYRAQHLANQGLCSEAYTQISEATAIREEAVKSGEGSTANDLFTVGGLTASPEEELPLSYFIEAFLLSCDNRLDEAEAKLAQAMGTFSGTSMPSWWQAQFDILRAEMALARDDLETAKTVAQALEKNLKSRRNLTGRDIEVMFVIGKTFAATGKGAEALAIFQQAIDLAKKNNLGLSVDQAMPYMGLLLAEAQRTPEQKAKLMGDLFQVVQVVRDSATAKDIAASLVELGADDPATRKIVKDWKEKKRQFDESNQELLILGEQGTTGDQFQDQLNREKKVKLADDIDRLEKEVAALDEAVKKAFPDFAAKVDAPVAIEDLLNALAPDEMVLQILPSSNGTLVVAITKEEGVDARLVELSARDIAVEVADLRVGFTIDETGYPRPFDVDRAYRFYQNVFSDLAPKISRTKHVVSIPGGPLLSYPFAAFVTEPPPVVTNADYTRVPFLGLETAISLTPSIRTFVSQRGAKPSRAPRSMLGFGDYGAPELISFTKAEQQCRAAKIRAVRERFDELPETADELRNIANLIGGDAQIVLRDNFTEQTVRNTKIEDFRLIWFATHGLLPGGLLSADYMPANTECEDEAALVTSFIPTSAGEEDDSLLSASEIRKLRLDADLVVLSACDTAGTGGTGEGTEADKYLKGEGLSGLARSFFQAGARSMLVSHWPVVSVVVPVLMDSMFKERTAGMAYALEGAQQTIINIAKNDPNRRIWSHPLVWAPFSLVGDGARPLEAPAPANTALR